MLGAIALLLLSNPYQELIDRQVKVHAVVGDPHFLRRASLDVRGRPPSLDEIAAVPDRDRLLESWLAGDDAARYWAAVWSDTLMQRTPGVKVDRPFFASWLANTWRERRPWSQIVEELLTASGSRLTEAPVGFLMSFGGIEDSTGGLARLFLGSSIECAQCHDHPSQDLKVADFYALNAFMARTSRKLGVLRDVDRGQARAPDGTVIEPRFSFAGLGPALSTLGGHERRTELAHQIAREPDFARAFVNRVWAQYLGRGLVADLDDLDNIAPEERANLRLLDRLAAQFVKDGHRIQPLIAGILSSRAYQAAAASPGGLAFQPRPINLRQLTTSILAVTGLGARLDQKRPDRRVQIGLQLLEAGGDQASITRALVLMNDVSFQLGFSARPETALGALLARAKDPRERLDLLFLTALTRKPTEEERAAFSAPTESKEWEDAFWALVNSAEFSSHD